MFNVISDIIAERLHQISDLKYTSGHDDQWTSGELLSAGEYYYRWRRNGSAESDQEFIWPFEKIFFKPRSLRENWVRAGALHLAERDRIYRLGGKAATSGVDFYSDDEHDSAHHVKISLAKILIDLKRLDQMTVCIAEILCLLEGIDPQSYIAPEQTMRSPKDAEQAWIGKVNDARRIAESIIDI